MQTLLIDACSFEHGKTYGYNSYLFNLLGYFNDNINDFKFNHVIVACDVSQICYFEIFKSLDIQGLNCHGYLNRFIQESFFYKSFNLKKNDVILFTGNYSSLNRQCHHVLVIHDLLFLRKKMIPSLLFRWQRKLFVPRSIKIADKIIAISRWVKKDIEFNYSYQAIDKVVSIYNYIDFKKYGYNPCERIKFLTNCEFFLVVSADYPYKHISTVIQAFGHYAIKNKKCMLFIVGNMSESRKTQIAEFPDVISRRIIILKDISNDDLSMLYRKSKAFISASEFEGFGMPLVEGMYLADKVISSNIEVAREVTNNMAIYFNSTDVKELHQIMQNIDHYPSLKKEREKISTQYCERNTSGKYIELLNSFVD